jgi:hypothetical protein
VKHNRHTPADPLEPPTLRETLWKLHVAAVEHVYARLQEPGVKPIWVSLALALLRLNDIRVSRGHQAAAAGLERLYSLSGMSAPFEPTTGTKKAEPAQSAISRLVKPDNGEDE